jgi:hypothetical protein
LSTNPSQSSNQPSTRQSPQSAQPDLLDAIEEWEDKNCLAYNQILLNTSATIQPLLDSTCTASTAWSILLEYFELKNASLTSTVCAQYETHVYTDGSSMLTYIAKLTDLWNQLGLLGEPISDQAHANLLLMNLPNTDEWNLFAMTIHNITTDPLVIGQRLTEKYARDCLTCSKESGTHWGLMLYSQPLGMG